MKRSSLVVLGLLALAPSAFAQEPAPAPSPSTAPVATQPAKDSKAGPSMQELKEKSEAGDADAMVRYGLALVDGRDGKVDTKAGVEWMKKSAEKNHPAGMYCYGRAVMAGLDGKPDSKAALDWIVKAAKAGDAKACMMLFDNLLTTVKTPQQAMGALELGEAAVKAGSQEAMIKLGMVYINGEVNRQRIPQDTAKGIALLEKASQLGSPVAPAYLGHIYSAAPLGVTRDYAKSFAYFQTAAERNDPMGVYGLAVAYGTGQGVEKNTIKAVELTKRGAAMGHIPSMRQLEKIYLQGAGVEKNEAEAEMWKKKIQDAEKAAAAAPSLPR